jgi:hypothetical protein
VSIYHDPTFVQDRIETLRREADRERLAGQLRRRRRDEKDNNQTENRNRTERRAAGRVTGQRRVLRWGAGA